MALSRILKILTQDLVSEQDSREQKYEFNIMLDYIFKVKQKAKKKSKKVIHSDFTKKG